MSALALFVPSVEEDAALAVSYELGWALATRSCVIDEDPLTVRLEYQGTRSAEAVLPWRTNEWIVYDAEGRICDPESALANMDA